MASPWSRLAVLLLLLVSRSAGIPKQLLYPYGVTTLPTDQDEASSQEIKLKVPIAFYDDIYESIYVNSNGLLSFLTDIPSFFNVQFPLDYPVIAPLYTNVDTRGSGAVFYRETQEEDLLERVMEDIRLGFKDIGEFEAKSLFIATWLNVGYHEKGFDKVNTYQAVIASDGSDSYLLFLYADGGIQWIAGISDQHSPTLIARAQAGLVSSDGRLYSLKGSGTDQVQNLDKWSNVDQPGVWLFHVGRTGPSGNVGLPDLVSKAAEYVTEPPNTCSVRSTECHSKAKCVDYNPGFCCFCQPTYYGNGISCLKERIPLRVNGRVSGIINGVNVDQLDLQSYVMTEDGRTYTAMSRIPDEVGFDLQTLNILGGVIGWLFAKPIGKEANGYQLTGGVFNHTTDLTFVTGDKITLVQHYLGLDVFDQLKMEAEIHGNLPTIPSGAKVLFSDYEEQYSKSSHGVIHSHSTQTYRVGDKQVSYALTVDQFIQFNECLYAPHEDTLFNLKVARNFISYEQRDHIVRYAMTAKVSPPGQDDPCIEGRKKCGPDSTCQTDGDSFQCVCNRGYQYLYGVDGSEDTAICVDINECITGISACDLVANCVNEPGSFYCHCPHGYTGDGRTCSRLMTCQDLHCHPDALCVESERGSLQCQCRPGYQGNGLDCTADDGWYEYQRCDVLSNCSPYGICTPGPRGYECVCLPGYEGDGYSCVDKKMGDESPVPTCFEGRCWCTPNYELIGQECVKMDDESLTGVSTQIFARPESVCITPSQCVCPQGFTLEAETKSCLPTPGAPRTDTMGPTHSKPSCNILNTCHPFAQCVYSGGQHQCQCNAGFEGDGYECNKIDVSCLEVDICDSNATCVSAEDNTRAICRCDPGFQGDGTLCSPIEECTRDIDCYANAKCMWVSHRAHHECVCEEGFIREGALCIHDVLLSSGCDVLNNCDRNAQCVLDHDHQEHVCRCNAGFTGDGMTCSPHIVGCNVLNNCGQGADCLYDPSAAGHRCRCRIGYRGDGITCVSEQTCQQNPFLCGPDASCVIGASGYHICQCNDGYTGNGVLCKVSSKYEGNFLLMNQGMATLRIPYNPTPYNPGRPIAIQYDQMAIGIDADCLSGRVYWSDITGHTIKSSNYDGSDVRTVVREEIGSPEGISIDWVNRNIYWTDSSKDTVEMSSLETMERHTIISEGLVNPRGIAVHPTKGKVFWSDWNRAGPKLEWANLDGSDRRVFLEGASVQLPNSLAIDFQRDELCWADAGSKAIECVSISRSIRRTLVSNCSYPFGLTISSENYYWTDWDTRKIESAQRPSGKLNKPISVPLGGSGKLYGIVAVPENCPR